MSDRLEDKLAEYFSTTEEWDLTVATANDMAKKTVEWLAEEYDRQIDKALNGVKL